MMEKPKFTPGPWGVRCNSRGFSDQIIAYEGRNDVAGAVGSSITRGAAITFPSSTEGEANARLIAAAPDLYAAMEWVMANGDGQEGRERMRAALAKVRGET